MSLKLQFGLGPPLYSSDRVHNSFFFLMTNSKIYSMDFITWSASEVPKGRKEIDVAFAR